MTAERPTEADASSARARVDRAAFAELYDRHLAGISAYCPRSLGDPERAKDATHQVFVRALESFARYREEGKSRQWLYAIAHNLIASEPRPRPLVNPLDAVDP